MDGPMRTTPRPARGYALLLVLMVLALISVGITTLLASQQGSAQTTGSMIERRRVFYACDGIGRAATVLAQSYMSTAAPSTQGLIDFICSVGGGGCCATDTGSGCEPIPSATSTRLTVDPASAASALPHITPTGFKIVELDFIVDLKCYDLEPNHLEPNHLERYNLEHFALRRCIGHFGALDARPEPSASDHRIRGAALRPRGAAGGTGREVRSCGAVGNGASQAGDACGSAYGCGAGHGKARRSRVGRGTRLGSPKRADRATRRARARRRRRDDGVRLCDLDDAVHRRGWRRNGGLRGDRRRCGRRGPRRSHAGGRGHASRRGHG